MIVRAKIRQVGNALGITLPKDFVKTQHLHKNDMVSLDLWKTPSARQLEAIVGMFPNMAPFERDHTEREFLPNGGVIRRTA